MLNIEFLKKSWYFEEIKIKNWEYLFNEWEKGDWLYIIISWKISIEKNIIKNNKEKKRKLSTLLIFDILWESALNWHIKEKEVSALALSDTTLLKISWNKKIEKFFKTFPEESIDLLKHIIYIWNKRLLKANREITATYEINKSISEIENIDFKNIFKIIEKIKDLIWCSYILYFEKSAAFTDYFILRYDTRTEWKMQDEIIEIKKDDLEIKILKESNFKLDSFNLINKLNIWTVNLWFLVVWRKNNIFSESEKNMLVSMWNSLSGIIKQKSIIQEEKNKNFMKNK